MLSATSCFIIFPLMIGLVNIAKPLTIILLTEKWLPSVPFMIIVSLTCMTWPFSVKSNAFNAIGRSDVSLKLNITEKSIGIFMMVISIRYGVYALVISFLITSIVNVLIGFYVTKKILNYTIGQQSSDVFPSLLISLATGTIVYALNILRIFFLSILTINNSQFFDFAHKLFWYLLSTIFVIGIWFLTIKIFKIKSIPGYTDIKYFAKNIK